MFRCRSRRELTLVLVLLLILLSLACDNSMDQYRLLEANSMKLKNAIFADKEIAQHLLSGKLDIMISSKLSIKVDHKIAIDTVVLNSIIAAIKRHADSCQPLYYWNSEGYGRELQVELFSVHERKYFEWVLISFKTRQVEVVRKFNQAISKLDFLAANDVWSFLQNRWQFYENRDGDYLPEHDKIVLKEAASEFNITKEEALRQFSAVEYRRLGIEPKASLPLRDQNIPVNLQVEKVFIRNGLLCVTLRNKTDWDGQLPTINLTCNKYNRWGSTFSSDGYQVIWFKDLAPGEVRTECSIRPQSPQYVELVAYINIDNMRKNHLKSPVQKANDPGETVIPVLNTDKIQVRP